MYPVDLFFFVILFILFFKISKFKAFQQIPIDYFVFGILLLYLADKHLHKQTEFSSSDNTVHVDGTSVAIDQLAFENLNRICKELFKDGTTTIPGDLIIDGHIKVRGAIYGYNGMSIWNPGDYHPDTFVINDGQLPKLGVWKEHGAERPNPIVIIGAQMEFHHGYGIGNDVRCDGHIILENSGIITPIISHPNKYSHTVIRNPHMSKSESYSLTGSGFNSDTAAENQPCAKGGTDFCIATNYA